MENCNSSSKAFYICIIYTDRFLACIWNRKQRSNDKIKLNLRSPISTNLFAWINGQFEYDTNINSLAGSV